MEISKERESLFWNKVEKNGPNGCWVWVASKFKDGYGQTKINKKNRKAHRVAYELVKGEIPDGLILLHTCDNPACVNPAHLIPGTHKENAEDRDKKDRAAKIFGSERYNAKLTEKEVLTIRKLFEKGMRQIDLIKKFNMSQPVMSRILNRRVWTHI